MVSPKKNLMIGMMIKWNIGSNAIYIDEVVVIMMHKNNEIHNFSIDVTFIGHKSQKFCSH